MVNNTTNINKTKERLNLACSTMEILIILCAWILASYIIEIVFSVIFVYIMHYAKYVIHVFALLSLSLLVTWLLHMLCWNKDHKTNYQFYSQLFQALTPVSIDVKGSPLVKSDSKPPPKNTQKSNSDICITFARNYFTTSFETTFLVQLMFGKPRYNPNSKEYKLTAIGFDIVGHSLFKPVVI